MWEVHSIVGEVEEERLGLPALARDKVHRLPAEGKGQILCLRRGFTTAQQLEVSLAAILG